jgi:transcriptional regulator with XRE-family HTH domain
MNKVIGKNLQQSRQRKGLTQAEVAKRAAATAPTAAAAAPGTPPAAPAAKRVCPKCGGPAKGRGFIHAPNCAA